MKPLDTTFPHQPLRDIIRIRIWKERIWLIQGETETYFSMFHLVKGGNGREKNTLSARIFLWVSTDLVSSDNSVRLISLWLALPSAALGAVGTL